MDLELSRMRPRGLKLDKERLFDDAMRQKMTANNLKDENVRLKTKIQIFENELIKKEKVIDQLIIQQENMQFGIMNGGAIISGGQRPQLTKKEKESHLVQNLKSLIRDQQATIN